MTIKNLLFNISFACVCLLVFLLAFEEWLVLPAWLQVAGRAHPLFLHIPIGLLVLSCFAEIFLPSGPEPLDELRDYLLLSSAFSLVITALMGLFLSREEGYDSETVAWHKWGGALISVLTLVWYGFRRKLRSRRWLNRGIGLTAVGMLIWAGHLGGILTHGEGYLLEPIAKHRQKPPVHFEEAKVFADMVQPILEEKCVSCHNPRKAKGQLILTAPEDLLKGGEHGPLWDSTEADFGQLLRRVHLPIADEDHMPPKGKPQLTEQELTVLEHWVRSGGDFELAVVNLPEGDTLREIAAGLFAWTDHLALDIEPAPEEVVRQLSHVYRLVQPLDQQSPALTVNFFSRAHFNRGSLTELAPVAPQVVKMDLNRMPLGDSLVSLLRPFVNLRELNLNFTEITTSGLRDLADLKQLRRLSLAGARLDKEALQVLQQYPALKEVYVWNTGLSLPEEELAKLPFRVQTGYAGDTVLLQLTPPIVQNSAFMFDSVIVLKFRHPIQGARIHYTLDGAEPDSVSSPVYEDGIRLDRDALIKYKVFREGWISSEVQSLRVLRKGYKPVQAELRTEPHKLQKGEGYRTLFDGILARNAQMPTQGPWLGYRGNSLDVVFALPDAARPEGITLSCVTDFRRNIFPPQSISVWAGDNPDKLRLVNILRPPLPHAFEPPQQRAYSISLKGTKATCIRVVAEPLPQVPAWRNPQRPPAWIFVDEIIAR